MAGQAWIWIVVGLGLGVLEVILPGYIFAGFAVAAVMTGGLIWLGVLGGNLQMALAVFALVSLGAWAGLRWAFGRKQADAKRWDRDINDN